jgi:hypothetical protein
VRAEHNALGGKLELLEQRTLLTHVIPVGAHGALILEPGNNSNGDGLNENPDGSPFQANDGDRWSTTATNGGGLGQGDPTTITWGIAPDNTPTNNGTVSNLIAFLDNNIGNTGATIQDRPWFSIFQDSFDRIEETTGIDFVFETADDGVQMSSGNSGILGTRADIRIMGRSIDGQSGGNTLAFNFFPNHGDMVIDTDNSNFYSDSTNNFIGFRNVLMHEVGHDLARIIHAF